MELKVIEAEYNNESTYLIGVEKNGKIIKALKFIEPNTKELFWTNRPEFAWHNSSKSYVESILKEILKTEAEIEAEVKLEEEIKLQKLLKELKE